MEAASEYLKLELRHLKYLRILMILLIHITVCCLFTTLSRNVRSYYRFHSLFTVEILRSMGSVYLSEVHPKRGSIQN